MNKFPRILLAADAAAGSGPGADPGEKKDRALKPGHVLVRNATDRPVAVDGIMLSPRVLDSKGRTVKEALEVELPEKHLKRLGGLVTKVAALAAMVFLGFAASAQQYSPTASTAYFATTNGASTVFSGGTNTIAALTTNTCNSKVALTKYDEVALEISFAYTGAGTSSQTFNFVPSVDGIKQGTAGQTYTFTIAGNGTTAVDLITNLYVGCPGYLFLTTAANTNASLVATNVLIRAVPKASRRGT